MPDLDDEVKAKLAALKMLYYTQLPDKVAEVAGAFNCWQVSQQPKDLFECFRRAHSLSGSGALYDAHDFGAKAKELEFLLTGPVKDNRVLNAAEINQSQALLRELANMALIIQASTRIPP